MFGKTLNHEKKSRKDDVNPQNGSRGRMTWDVPIFFGIIFALSVAELCFAIDAFVYLQKQHKWWSGTEKARMGFLIFSCARTVVLSAVYTSAHCCRVKNLLDTLHTVFLVVSTIIWIISGVLIYQMWTYVECQNEGIANSFGEFKSQVAGGLSLCHEIKIIEIVAWVIAGVSVIATIPVLRTYLKKRTARKARRSGNDNTASA